MWRRSPTEPPKKERRLLNPAGQVQGGFLAAMLDGTLEPALVATLSDGDAVVASATASAIIRRAETDRRG
jgi:acyl-coenzyme A thioesterase PaaI-like protein